MAKKEVGKPKLVVESVAIIELKKDPRNARLHPERNLEAIRASLERFGQQKPIVVDTDGVVIAGNGTMQVAESLGWTHIDVVRTTLKGREALEFALADNRTGELSEWDVQMLGGILADIRSDGVVPTGWTDKELDRFLNSITPPDAPAAFTTVDENIETHYECPKCHYQWSGKINSGDA